MTPIEQRAHDLVARLPEHAVGAEVGVWRGQFAELLLRLHPTLTLYMVDRWNSTDHQPRHSRTQESLMQEAVRRTDFAELRAIIHQMDSLKAASFHIDASLDFVFIDADHSYEGCAADIRAWTSKVKPGGLIGGHDYDDRFTKERGYGVVQAVDEAAARYGWDLELSVDSTWWVRL